MSDFTQADRDELAGVGWMRSLPQAEHAAIPLAIDAGAHIFRASCRCGWRGPERYRRGATGRALKHLNTDLWKQAAADADEHNLAVQEARA